LGRGQIQARADAGKHPSEEVLIEAHPHLPQQTSTIPGKSICVSLRNQHWACILALAVLQTLEAALVAIHASTRNDSTMKLVLGHRQAGEVTSKLILLTSALITLIIPAALRYA